MENATKESAPVETAFIDETELLRRLPVCARTLATWREQGVLPYIRAAGRRIIYDWPTVRESLLRRQQGGQ